ncbi:MCE family protein [Saccharopolyspora rhizosphaerae]|uniref:MCE family protein n=1 Tax=Saccharopolyspora rhizosphaerae TaxID=2492662 RepID=A0A3R8QQK9_9PSEU|nr:MCE family protein [Saccharopolyspora rhizosphaerae]RRO17503.1 MCE family protein [Saccharopolyspora rhizosphaerae]
MSKLGKAIAALCVLVLVTAGVVWWTLASAGTTITAYFDKAVGLYAGSSVRVLGVKVGQIEEVRPEGEVVRVRMQVDDGVRVPANANAVVVAPSLVSDRYVQLTPAYTSGEVMASGAVLDRKRTATPAELDELYKSVNALSTALGPEGANRDGALNEVLTSSGAALEGNGQDLNTTIKRLGELSATLSENQGDMFATVQNLNQFTGTLAQSDAQIRELYGRMADTTGYLASEREQLGASLHSLALALEDVQRFVHDNRDHLSSNVQNLTGVTQALVDQRNALAEVLDLLPLATSNFINAYDSASGGMASRWNPQELAEPPILMVCRLITSVTPIPEPVPQHVRDTCQKLNPIIQGTVPLPSVAEILGKVQGGGGDVTKNLEEGPNPVPLPLVDAMRRGAGTP